MLSECQKQEEVIYYLLNCRMVFEIHTFWLKSLYYGLLDLSDQWRSQNSNVRGSLASAGYRGGHNRTALKVNHMHAR
jgi:hypothetical protein